MIALDLVMAAAVPVTVALLGVLAAVAVIDLRSFRIPDVLSLPLIAAGLMLAPPLRGTGLSDHMIGAAVGYALFAAIGAVHFRRRGVEGLGLGDAKLFAAGGAWLGWQALPALLLVASVGGLVFALTLRRGKALAFGPWLALGMALLWLWPGLAGVPFG